ncbi:MAG: MBL fold metallo-hydrolase [Mariprofundaceae bacterium]
MKIREIDIEQAIHEPTLLFQDGGHHIYWLGITEPTVFRTNTYLIRDGDQAILVDPGNRMYFNQVKKRVSQILPPEEVSGLIACHQDPDVIASMPDWLAINPDMQVFTSPRTQVLLPHYGQAKYRYEDVEASPELHLPSGTLLSFVPAPYLHFAGAFATYDATAKCLLSGDVFASLYAGARLWADDLEALTESMGLFHRDYMASNIAARGFVNRLDGLEIAAILPQHGSLIGGDLAGGCLEWLRELYCGTDLTYPELS